MKKKNQTIKTDSKENKMLKVLIERHNALARYVGVPYCIDPDVVASSPASFDKHGKLFADFPAYKVSLAPYVDDFNNVVFSASNNGKDTVCGYILDKDGNIESVAKAPVVDGAMLSLPLTPESHTLIASVPAIDGKPAPEDILIRLNSFGLHTDFKRVMTEILSRVMELEDKFKELCSSSQNIVAANNG